jgi:hypothetical protein
MPEYPKDIFRYQYLAGPVLTESELHSKFTEGNCRFALQLYFFRIHGKFFERDNIYLPGGYKVWGNFLYKEESFDLTKMKTGDVIYAQNLRNKAGALVDKNPDNYRNKDEWLYYLHSLIYLGTPHDSSNTHYVWHATHIEGGPAVWTWDKFLHYYKPISVKRVI